MFSAFGQALETFTQYVAPLPTDEELINQEQPQEEEHESFDNRIIDFIQRKKETIVSDIKQNSLAFVPPSIDLKNLLPGLQNPHPPPIDISESPSSLVEISLDDTPKENTLIFPETEQPKPFSLEAYLASPESIEENQFSDVSHHSPSQESHDIESSVISDISSQFEQSENHIQNSQFDFIPTVEPQHNFQAPIQTTSSINSFAFISNPELEKKIQQKYRDSLEKGYLEMEEKYNSLLNSQGGNDPPAFQTDSHPYIDPQVQNFRQDFTLLQDKYQALEKLLEDKTRECEDYKVQFSNCLNQNRSLNEQISGLEKSFASVEEIQNQLKEKKTVLGQQVNQIFQLQDHVKELQKQNELNQRLLQESESIHEKLRDECNQYRQLLSNQQAQATEPQTQGSESNSIPSLPYDLILKHIKHQIESLANSTHDFQKTNYICSSFDEKLIIESIEEPLNALHQKISESYQREIKYFQSHEILQNLQTLLNQLPEAKANNDPLFLIQHLSQQSLELESEQHRVKDLQSTISTLEEKLSQLQQQHDSISHKLYEQETEMTNCLDIKAKYQKMEVETRQLHQVINQLRSHRKNSTQDFESLQQEHQSMKDKHTSYQTRIEELQALLQSKDQQIIMLTSSIEETKQMQKHYQSLQGDNQQRMSQLHELQLQLSLKEQEIYALQQQTSNQKLELQLLSDDLTQRKQEIINLQDIIRNFSNEKKLSEQSIQFQVQERHRVQEEFEKIKSILQEKQKEIDLSVVQKQINQQLTKELQQEKENSQLLQRNLQLQLQQEKEKMNLQIASMLQETQQMLASQGDIIDKTFVSNLIVTYFKRRRSREVLELISKVLSFNEEQLVDVGLKVPPVTVVDTFFSSIMSWRNNQNTPSDPQSTDELDPTNKNLAELWVNFLISQTSDVPEGSS